MRTEFTMTRRQFIIATVICGIIVAAAVCYGLLLGNAERREDPAPDKITGQAQQTENITAGSEGTEDAGASLGQQEGEQQARDASGGIIVSTPKYALPLEGEVIRDFSQDTLVYYETLDQYMVHEGVDIAAEVGTQVKAATDGVVSKILPEDEMGVTVWVAYPDEVTVAYGNLDSALSVEEGDALSQGEVIGVIGQTSLYEKNDPSHLHLEVMQGELLVDPSGYFPF